MIDEYISRILSIQVSTLESDFQSYFRSWDIWLTVFLMHIHTVALIALVTLFIFGALPQAYIFSFLAKKPNSAFSSFCVLTILTGTATLTLISLYELKYEQTASLSFKLAFAIFRKYTTV